MKPSLFGNLITAVLLFVQAGASAADPPASVITYSTNPQYPPYHWAISKHAFDGASIELLDLVKPPGIKLQAKVYPWKRVLYMAEEGGIDLLLSLRQTPERDAFLQFTKHRAFPNPIVVFVRADRQFPFNEWADLAPYLGGVSFGDTFGAGFDEYWRQNLRMEEAPTLEHNFRMLAAGRIDYFVTGYYAGMAYIAAHPSSTAFVTIGQAISNRDIHFAFSLRSAQLHHIEYIDQRLGELDRAGIPEAILAKHLKRYNAKTPSYSP